VFTNSCLQSVQKARATEGVMISLHFSTVCGKPVRPITEIQRILGGKSAGTGNFPWQALTGIHGRGGGALLGDRWILTAAHTIFPKEAAGNNVSLDQLAEGANIFLAVCVMPHSKGREDTSRSHGEKSPGTFTDQNLRMDFLCVLYEIKL
uniref:Peptidase S1 domain-containing protein n=1 Tax=Accipiter nisus TaxID=211598 RepID=A0A8B9N7W3_9AVES